jgi:hypothetical protein
MKKRILPVLLLLGFIVGIVHAGLALAAIFAFREDEPIWSWLCIGAGPASTLLAVIVAAIRPRIGGAWLLAGGLASLLALVILEGSVTENALQCLIRIAAPMAALGAAFVVIGRKA